MDNTLRITEIFFSLQGESNTIGIPTTFIRLTGCPLRCSYCDTAYAFNGGQKQTLWDILDHVKQYNTRYITVTGGEPLAQRGCIDLLKVLVDEGYIVSLETSGALDVSKVDKKVVKILDLKTPASGELDKNRYENLAYLNQQDQVKFVIADDQDYDWSKTVMETHRLSQICQVLFSPVQGLMKPERLANRILADQLPVRFQIQLHKYLWNDVQGK